MVTKQPISFLEKDRFKAIYGYLALGKPSWDFVGDYVNGKPITDEEVLFVTTKLAKRGIYL